MKRGKAPGEDGILVDLLKDAGEELYTRLTKPLDENQPRLFRFRSGCSTLDHLHTINQLIEKSNEFNKPICLAFVDYEKAFDSVEQEGILNSIHDIILILETAEELQDRLIDLNRESLKVGLKLNSRYVFPSMTYGSETWKLNKSTENKLRRAQRAMERIMIGLSRRDKKRIRDIQTQGRNTWQKMAQWRKSWEVSGETFVQQWTGNG
ncbi:uncharacterized protein [Penaeus vannamei]|uniref:uncharacterized protein n=1 Tax=Penaeus vannamei TaxID=6689 RepID=UPI00387F4858